MHGAGEPAKFHRGVFMDAFTKSPHPVRTHRSPNRWTSKACMKTGLLHETGAARVEARRKVKKMRQFENAFQEFVDGVGTASDKAAFRAVAERATERLGFRCFAYLGLAEHGHTLISTYPKDWTAHYLDERYDLIDPVIGRARSDRDLFRWSGAQMAKGRGSQVKRFFGEAAEFGIEKGVTIPIPAGFDRFAAFTLAADKHGPDLHDKVAKAKDILHLMGMYFHAHAEAALKPPVSLAPSSPLSQREAECLAWTSRGRTMDQIGQIVGVKTRTIAFHLDSARAKLGAENVAHAVALALRRRLIP